MEARWMKRTLLGSLLALPLLFASCSDTPLAPAPEQQQPAAPTLQHAIYGWDYQIVRGEDGTAAEVSFISDEEGGVIKFGPHSLTIPAGAVSSPTRFKAVLPFDDRLYVELSATSLDSSVENDVGSAGFLKPLRLTMSYSTASQWVNESTVIIGLYHPEDGTIEPLTSWKDETQKTVTAEIPHFSAWVIAD